MASEYSDLFSRVSKRIKSVYDQPTPKPEKITHFDEPFQKTPEPVKESVLSDQEAKEKFIRERVSVKEEAPLSKLGVTREEVEHWSDQAGKLNEINDLLSNRVSPDNLFEIFKEKIESEPDPRDRSFYEFLHMKFYNHLYGRPTNFDEVK
jgi:hypothetical protein